MIVEERVYTTVAGGVPRYLDAWNRLGRDVQIEHLGAPLGVFSCDVGDLNTLTFLWPYTSAGERADRRARLMNDPRFSAFRGAVRDLLVSQRNRILLPVQPLSEGNI
ncbi:NIPSNAP family protein [Mycolicibacterium sp. CH28]|uniref:NIPSNAP family protein n=1 Tax=Mycolicibacterium sp. CH28 TaxID=2512237 RepID=UPI001080CAFC|nr:NIPSNAP family protein [Mycolicibacterium sp. CH28]TGD88037.1 NIPSNAP family protein [Mycolicibacterium sp. CH28]